MHGWGERIRQARANAKITQKELAEELGVNEVTIRRYESESTEPGINALSQIARLTKKPVGYFFFGSQQEESPYAKRQREEEAKFQRPPEREEDKNASPIESGLWRLSFMGTVIAEVSVQTKAYQTGEHDLEMGTLERVKGG